MHGDPPAGPRNRLADETSPYLLQHAANPVDWHPWGEDAIAKARAEDKPILLSIGYSACHWCHVMAHESFEDEATAAVMNRLFVNVKVDREERPDLDKVYQLAHQVLTQRGGGWPLTMFLAPDDLTPFFGGTYFPKDARYGMPAFAELLDARRRVLPRRARQRRAARTRRCAACSARSCRPAPQAGLAITREPLERRAAAPRGELRSALRRLRACAEVPAPRLARVPRCADAGHAGTMAPLTLRRMAEGGIFDQLGGGFCRYSVDPFWMIPHFEKMLYDNGALLALLAQAAVAAGDAVLREAALDTAGWALGEMRAPGGAFYAALDADSEGHEGKFYVWQRDEVERCWPRTSTALLARRYGLDREPNFEGAWHLHAFVGLGRPRPRDSGLPLEQAQGLLDAARAKLLAARGTRVRPGLDDKILTAWNGLMIRGLAIAGRLLAAPALTDAALAAIDFLRREAWRDGRLYAAWKDGAARFPAYLDDHAFLLDALLEALQSRFRSEDLEFALPPRRRAARALRRPRARRLLVHGRGRGPAARAAPRASPTTRWPPATASRRARLRGSAGSPGSTRYLDAAEATVRGGYASLARAPEAHAAMLNALDEYLEPVEIVVIRGAGRGAGRLAVGARGRLCAATDGDRDSGGRRGTARGARDQAREAAHRRLCLPRAASARSRIERLDAPGLSDFTALNFASPGSSLV